MSVFGNNKKSAKEKREASFFDFDEITKNKIIKPKTLKHITKYAHRLNSISKSPRKAQAHFDKTKGGFKKHNLRLPDEYGKPYENEDLLPEEYRKPNEFWQLTDENGKILTQEEIFRQELAKFGKKKGKRPKFENSTWEAIITLNEQHTMEDLKKVYEYIEKTLNITCFQAVIHRDEGIIKTNEKGEKEVSYNYHAHLNFVTVKDKKQNYRLTYTKKKMPEIQTEVANILNMPRGEFGSKAKHLQPKEYRMFKQMEKTIQQLANDKYLLTENLKKAGNSNKVKSDEIANLNNQIENKSHEMQKLQHLLSSLKQQRKNDYWWKRKRTLEKLKNERNKNAELRSKLENTSQSKEIENLLKNENDELRQGYNKVLLENREYRLKYEKLEKENQVLKENPSQNDKNGSNLAENQKSKENIPQTSQIDLNALKAKDEKIAELNAEIKAKDEKIAELRKSDIQLNNVFAFFEDPKRANLSIARAFKDIKTKLKQTKEIDSPSEIAANVEKYRLQQEKNKLKSQNQGFSR